MGTDSRHDTVGDSDDVSTVVPSPEGSPGRDGADDGRPPAKARRICPSEFRSQLAREERVVNLFRPANDDHILQKGRIRDLADKCVVEMQGRVHTPHITEEQIKRRFLDSKIPQQPVPLEEYIESITSSFVKDSTQVACPRQIGHMTCSLPQYLPPLAELVTAMHQNVVKTETAKTVTLLEKQVLAFMHRLIYGREDTFYDEALQNTEAAMGMFTSGGTIANLTGLWVARNSALGPDHANGFAGVEHSGILKAASHYGYAGAVVVGSELMHYSMKKATDILGIGIEGLVTVPFDERYRVRIDELAKKLDECKRNRICVIAIVGLAGATETGSIDDIAALADLARRYGTHLHVDAAWGGPCLFSKTLGGLMDGIQLADTVTIDGHKQLFMPMGCGMLALRDPEKCKLISKTASYIIRTGSSDQGKFTLEGSRPGNAVYMHANLYCIGASGYETLMDRSARVCRYMAAKLRSTAHFEVLFEPMTNILLYRYMPGNLRGRLRHEEDAAAMSEEDWKVLDEANMALQERQKTEGRTFVSRTTVFDFRHGRRLVALRIVIGNPITEESDIDAVIADQLRIIGSGVIPDDENPEETSLVDPTSIDGNTDEQYWSDYWERMPEAARLFFLNDIGRFRNTLVAPTVPSALA